MPPATKPPDVRTELVRLMRATISDHAHWTYRPVRPLPVPDTWRPGQHVDSDCSFGVKLLCKWAGAPDPTGYGYAGYGNSESIHLHLKHLASPAELLPGDIVTVGRGGREHAAMVLEPGPDPRLWSDGHQGAPNSYLLSDDKRDEKQYLRLPVRKTPVSAEDKLRAKTGYWAWLAWKQGEGVDTWKPYGPSNKAVRPNVPRVIPPTWWAARVRFLAARKRGDKATTAP